ncbi:MAG: tetratricopeptide repeat protein [Rhodopseudomonas palustris]|nr:tetratricopeptide repeat protein [Rhodopseudomonas palustris]
MVRYGTFLIKTGAFEEALKIAEDLRADDKRRFMFHVIRGQALFGQEKYEEALADLEQANRAYNSDTAVPNVLGRCYPSSGPEADALERLQRLPGSIRNSLRSRR